MLEQARLFVTGFVGGLLLCLSYEGLRLFRRLIKHPSFWVSVEDVLFFVSWAVAGFFLLYPQTLGQVRGFLLLSIVLGVGLYLMLKGRLKSKQSPLKKMPK